MKKIVVTLLMLTISVMVFAGCGKKFDDSSKNLNKIDVDKYVLKLGEYKGLEVSGTKEVINDESVNSYIEVMRSYSKVPVEVTGRAVQSGDIANIDFEGKLDGVAFDGGTAQGYDLTIGSGSFIPGFEDGLIGLNVGDTKDLDLTFPEDYGNKELAGKAVVFTVKVNKISESTMPTLDDEFVKNLGITDCETVEQLKAVVREELENNAEAAYQNDLQMKAMNALIEKCEFAEQYPQGIVDYYKEMFNNNIENQAIQMGMTLDDFITNYYGIAKEEFDTTIEDGAKTSSRQALICMKIANTEKLQVTDEELDEAIEANYANFGFESAEAYKENGDMEEYKNQLLIGKVLDFLVENAKITEEATVAE